MIRDSGLLAWLESPSRERGIRFARRDGSWDWWSYARLAALVHQCAGALRANGLDDGDVVAIVEHSGPAFIGALYGSMRAGLVPTPVAPPMTFRDRDAYADHVRGLLAAARPAAILCASDIAATLAPLAATADAPLLRTQDLLSAPPPAVRSGWPPAELALLQFTSGSSGRVRGVRVTHRALTANVGAIQRWLGMGPGDPTASWLPVHHDMGLVGCLLAPVATGSDLWLMSPEEFVRRPLRYLSCFGRDGARLTAMPAFGLAHLVRRLRPDQLSDMDFSGWRAVIVGAERVAPAVLDAFHALCGPRGLSRRALLPAYGLAEATLAVTGLPLEQTWSVVDDPAHGSAVGCGRALTGVDVVVVDDDEIPVADGDVGEIVVGGVCVAAGYQQPDPDGSSRFQDGRIHTGDAGFVRDGQLFVLGRMGDGLKVRGRTIFAEDLESLLSNRLGVPPGRVTCLLGTVAATPTAVIAFELGRAVWIEAAESIVRPVLDDARVVVLDLPMGSVPRTSSGKPRRRPMWRDLAAGQRELVGG